MRGLPSNPGSAMLCPEPVTPPQTSASPLCNGTAKKGYGRAGVSPLGVHLLPQNSVCVFPLINKSLRVFEGIRTRLLLGTRTCEVPGEQNLYKLLCT